MNFLQLRIDSTIEKKGRKKMKTLEKKVEFNLRVALLIVLPFFIFSCLALSLVFAENNLEAHVTIVPTTKVDCKPDTLIAGSSVEWINCFIEMSNADVHNINVNTVKLGITTKVCSVFADPSTFSVADFNHDGKLEAFVRFNRLVADTNCFNPLSSTTTFTLVISGLVSGIPFSGTDSLLYTKTCQDVFVQQMQANTTSTESGKIITLASQSVDLNKYSAKSSSLNGFFTCRNTTSNIPRLIGDMKFFSTGTLTEPVHITWIPGLDFVYYKKTPVRIAAVLTTFDNCVATSNPVNVECVGKGAVYVDKDQPFSRETINLDTMRVTINGNTATVKGGHVFNDIIDVENLQVSKVTIKPAIPKI